MRRSDSGSASCAGLRSRSGRAYAGSRDTHRYGAIGFRDANRFEHSHDFGAPLFEPRRQQQGRAELIEGFVARETAFGCRGALHQDPAGATAVNRVEVIAVFDFGAIGVAELVVDALLLGQGFIARDVERHVVRRAFTEDPASLWFFRLVMQNDSPGRAAGTDFEPRERPFLAGPLEAEGIDEETLGFAGLADRQNGAEETADRRVHLDFFCLPSD